MTISEDVTRRLIRVCTLAHLLYQHFSLLCLVKAIHNRPSWLLPTRSAHLLTRSPAASGACPDHGPGCIGKPFFGRTEPSWERHRFLLFGCPDHTEVAVRKSEPNCLNNSSP